MMTKHVDDLKICGEEDVVALILKELEREFGKLTCKVKQFTNTGIRHNQLPNYEIEQDQVEYIAALKPITHPDVVELQ